MPWLRSTCSPRWTHPRHDPVEQQSAGLGKNPTQPSNQPQSRRRELPSLPYPVSEILYPTNEAPRRAEDDDGSWTILLDPETTPGLTDTRSCDRLTDVSYNTRCPARVVYSCGGSYWP